MPLTLPNPAANNTPPVAADQDRYMRIGEQFISDRLIPVIMRILASHEIIESEDHLGSEDAYLVHELAFFVLAVFEGANGVEVDGQSWFTPLHFAADDFQAPSELVRAQSGILHGEPLERVLDALTQETPDLA